VTEFSTIGLDIAKQTSQAHGADAIGQVLFRRKITRGKLLEFFWSWSSSSAIWLRPHRSGQAAFPHPAPPGSNPPHAARGVQGCVIRGLGKGKHAVTVSNQSHPNRRFFWLRRLRQLNQMRRTSWRNPFRERQLCGRPK
jgi:hypothetical protein